jgi:hypothetical protein
MKYLIVIWIAAIGLTLAVITHVAQAYTQEELDFISGCFSNPSGEGCTVESSASATVNAATLTFRDDDTRNPRISKDGTWVTFNRVLGGGRRAGWQDGSPLGVSVTLGEVRGVANNGTTVGVDSFGTTPYAGALTLPLFAPLYENGAANDVSNDGNRVVGNVFDANSGMFGTGYHAVWDYSIVSMSYGLDTKPSVNFGPNARLHALTPDNRFAAGASATNNTTGTFRMQAVVFDIVTDTITVLPFGPMAITKGAEAYALSDDGVFAVGYSLIGATQSEPVVWGPPGVYTSLPLNGGFEGVAYTTDALGGPVGGTVDNVAVVWDSSRTYMRDVAHIAEAGGAVVPAGCALETVRDMSEIGDRLVGDADCSGIPTVYELGLAIPLPEPSLAVGLMAGAGLLTALGRKG